MNNSNVWEWTCSEWREQFDGGEQQCANPQSTVARVLRGGSWRDKIHYARSAFRDFNGSVYRNDNLGFRVLCPAPIE